MKGMQCPIFAMSCTTLFKTCSLCVAGTLPLLSDFVLFYFLTISTFSPTCSCELGFSLNTSRIVAGLKISLFLTACPSVIVKYSEYDSIPKYFPLQLYSLLTTICTEAIIYIFIISFLKLLYCKYIARFSHSSELVISLPILAVL